MSLARRSFLCSATFDCPFPAIAYRRLESLENRTEQISQVVADIQAVSGLRDDAAKERLGALEKTLREVHRGVQIIRDKQVGGVGGGPGGNVSVWDQQAEELHAPPQVCNAPHMCTTLLSAARRPALHECFLAGLLH